MISLSRQRIAKLKVRGYMQFNYGTLAELVKAIQTRDGG